MHALTRWRSFRKHVAAGMLRQMSGGVLLMKPHLQDRAQLQNLPSDIQSILSKYKPQLQVDTREPPLAKSQKRCRLCELNLLELKTGWQL